MERPGTIHAVVNDAEDIDNPICRQTKDQRMPRFADTPCRNGHMSTAVPKVIGPQIGIDSRFGTRSGPAGVGRHVTHRRHEQGRVALP